MDLENTRLAVIGLGYVGLPLAVEFAKFRPVVGYDINALRVAELRGGHDRTLEVDDAELATTAAGLTVTDDPAGDRVGQHPAGGAGCSDALSPGLLLP